MSRTTMPCCRPAPRRNRTPARSRSRSAISSRPTPDRVVSAPVRALDQLSIRVAAGTIFGLLGPERRGQVDDGQDPDHSCRGRTRATPASPASTSSATPGRCAARSAWSSQKASSDPMATGRENLLLAARIQGLSRRAAATRAGELLDRFGLTDAADRLVQTYSGGMARRLDVAIGLVHRPQVLFLDEPTTGLDPEARAEMWAEIEAARRRADDRAAHDPLPRRSGPARRPAGHRRPRPRRRRRHGRRPQDANCTATPSSSNSAPPRRWRPPSLGWAGCRGCTRSARTGAAACAPAPTTVQPPSQPCWPAWTTPASRWLRSPCLARPWMTCTCGTSAAPIT